MPWKSMALGALGVSVSVALIYFSGPLAAFLLRRFGVEEAPPPPPSIAEAVKASGPSFFRKGSQGSFLPLKPDQVLRRRDEVKTERGGRVQLRFFSGYEIDVLEETQIIVDKWRSWENKGPDHLSLLRGEINLLKSGKLGQLYIVKDNEIYAPENVPKASSKTFKISPSSASAGAMEARELPDSTPKPEQLEPLTAASPSSLPEKSQESTLTSAYIESVLSSQAALFRRCQLTSLRDNKPSRGNYLFSFIITTQGQIKNIRLLQKSFENSTLEACCISVLERTKFKAFKGSDISLSYPLNFE